MSLENVPQFQNFYQILYQCMQKDGQSLQDFSHDMMSKIDKLIKKDSKAIKDLNAAIPNQFAENVKEAWLRRDLKKE